MKRTTQLLLMLLVCVATWAQSTDEKKAFINSIKKDPLYLSADQVGESEDVAINLADGKLLAQVNDWVAEQKKLYPSQVISATSHEEMIKTITMPRGNMFRAFRYVKKSDLLLGGDSTPAADDNPPVADDNPPAADDNPPAADDNPPVVNNDPPVTDDNPPVTPTDDGDAVFSFSDGDDTPNLDATIETVTDSETDTTADYPEAVQELSKLTAFSQLKDCILRLKKEGKISNYGKYEQLSPKEDYYLIIYNTSGELEGVLSPAKPERKNVKTGQPDSEKNYPGRGAFGVKL